MIFSTAGREALVTGDRVQAGGFLRGQHRLDPLAGLAGALLRAGVDPQRPAVGLEFLDVDHPQPGRRQGTGGGQQGQVGEVLVVDGVVLAALDQPEQVRELQRDRALVLDQRAQARPRSPGCRARGRRRCSPATRSARPCRCAISRPVSAPRNWTSVVMPAGPGGLGHVRGRLDAEHRDARRLEVLQQVAVVAGHLGDQAVRGQLQALDHRLRVPLRVRHPRVGVRGKVGVVGEDILAGHVSGKLHEQAFLAQADVERIERFRFVELVLGNVALAKRRHSEIDERTGKRRTA